MDGSGAIDAGALTQAFLSGQGMPVALRDVENELSRLWGPSAKRADGPEIDHPTVTRVSLANLVAVVLEDRVAPIEEALETVVALHPCRVILVRANEDPARRVRAEIAAQCHLPAPGHPQVCSERIILGVGPSGHDLLPGAIRPLLESDLPMIVWWASDPAHDAALRHDLADEASRMLMDLPDPGLDGAALRNALDASSACRCIRDLAWFGTDRWREMVAQFFDAPGASSSLERVTRVEIATAVPRDGGRARVGAWMAAWLAGRLGWRPGRVEATGSGVAATFESASGEVSVALTQEVDASVPFAMIRDVRVEAGAGLASEDKGTESFRVVRMSGSDHVRLEVCSETRCALPRLVRSPEYDRSRRVAAALEARREDRVYANALPHLLWLMGA